MNEKALQIDAQTNENIQKWLNGAYSEQSKQEVRRLQSENVPLLIDSFYQHLSFGTGGLRGIMGVGTNRMNIYTVRAATQGLAHYILKQNEKEPKVVISYDSRHHSKQFAEETAKVLIGNGIRVYLFNELRPIPLLSFAIRHLKCSAGVMLTASHNPPQYNGYKVCWSDGAQVLPPHDTGIIEEVQKIKDPSQVQIGTLDSSNFSTIGVELDEAYLKAVAPLALHPEKNSDYGKQLSIVYTPLHGTGGTIVPKALNQWGFTSLHLVEEQMQPDGSFTTCESPNPEERAALEKGITLLEKVKGDLLIATDPDSDRMGIASLDIHGLHIFNGNEIAALLLYYLLSEKKALSALPPSSTAIKTIVTSELCHAIAAHFGAKCENVLTGFKYIGQKITQWESFSDAPHFIFGCEESYGYLCGAHIREKDAVSTPLVMAEYALHLKLQNLSVYDALFSIYKQFGLFVQKTKSLSFEGKEGAEKMQALMQKMRNERLSTIGTETVQIFEDYLNHQSFNLENGKEEPLTLPTSNVLLYRFKSGGKLVIRPSGTEPKIKIYVEIVDRNLFQNKEEMLEKSKLCHAQANHLIESFESLLE